MTGRMALVAGFLVLADPCGAAAKPSGAVASLPDKRRVAEIAAHLEKRPRLHFEIPPIHPSTRNAYINAPLPSLADDLYLEFKRTGRAGTYVENAHHLNQMFNAFVYMAAAGDDPAFKRAVECIDTINALRSWALPGNDADMEIFNRTRYHVDLGAADLGCNLAQALRILGHKIPTATRERAKAELEKRFFAPYRETNAAAVSDAAVREHRNWWFYGRSNWCAICHSGVVRATLALVDDVKERAAIIEAAERGLRFYFESFLPDGYCIEGAGYWEYGYSRFLWMAREVKGATGGFVDYTRLPGARESMLYAFNSQLTKGLYPKFADGGGYGPSADMLELGTEFWPEMRPLLKGDLPLRTVFPDAHVYIGRSRRLAIAVKGGTNGETHGHHDLGSWNLVADGVIIAGDPGPETYSRATFDGRRYKSRINNSYGHPVPTVDGELQFNGGEAFAKIVSTNLTDEVDEVQYDLSHAYRCMVDRKYGRVLRKIAVKRGKTDAVIVADDFRLKRKLPFESVIVSTAAVTRSPDGKSLTLEQDGVKVGVKAGVKVDGKAADGWRLREETIENPNHPDVHRVSVAFDEPVAKAVVGWRFTLAR